MVVSNAVCHGWDSWSSKVDVVGEVGGMVGRMVNYIPESNCGTRPNQFCQFRHPKWGWLMILFKHIFGGVRLNHCCWEIRAKDFLQPTASCAVVFYALEYWWWGSHILMNLTKLILHWFFDAANWLVGILAHEYRVNLLQFYSDILYWDLPHQTDYQCHFSIKMKQVNSYRVQHLM